MLWSELAAHMLPKGNQKPKTKETVFKGRNHYQNAVKRFIPKFTVSSRELGSAPANEAIKILVIVAPRGIMTLFLICTNCSSFTVFSRSKMSNKNVNIEWQASLEKAFKTFGQHHCQNPQGKTTHHEQNTERERVKPVLHCDSNHCAIYKW